MQMFFSTFFADTTTWNRRCDRRTHTHNFHWVWTLFSLLWRNRRRNVGVLRGWEGGWWIRKDDKSRGKQNKSFLFCVCVRSWWKSNSFHVSSLYTPKQTNMLFVHSAVCLQDGSRLTAVYNYAGLIVIIIKWLHRSLSLSLSLSVSLTLSKSKTVVLDVLILM